MGTLNSHVTGDGRKSSITFDLDIYQLVTWCKISSINSITTFLFAWLGDGYHFSYAGGGTRKVTSALRAGCCTRRGEIFGGSCVEVDFQIGNLSQITQYFRGGWRLVKYESNFYKRGRSSSKTHE